MTSMEVCVRCHRLNTRAAVWPASLLPGALEPFQSAARRIWHPSGAALAPWPWDCCSSVPRNFGRRQRWSWNQVVTRRQHVDRNIAAFKSAIIPSAVATLPA